MNTQSFKLTLLLGLRMLRRDWRSGELAVLAVAIVVAVTCFTAVAFFTDRIGQALKFQASELIGADLRVAMDHPIRDELLHQAQTLGLTTAETQQFRSMVLAGDNSMLAEIKAVSDSYPLRGRLRISDQAYITDHVTQDIPPQGEVWVEPRLLTTLKLNVGDVLQVGVSKLRIAAVLSYEPDRSGEMFSIAPRLMMNREDLPATQLIQEGSRIRYNLLVAGETKIVERYRNSIKKHLQRGENIEGVQDARQEVRIALERAQQFLGLAAIVSLILSCVAIAMSARRYAERHLNTCALMRCIGAQQQQISMIFLVQMLVLGITASLVACGFGYLAQTVLVDIMQGLFVVTLPPASLLPVLSGVVIGLVSLLGFAIPSVIRLRDVPPLRVLRKDLGGLPPFAVSSYLAGILALCGVLIWQAGDVKLGLIIIGGIAGTVLLLVLISHVLLRLLQTLPAHSGVAWRFGLNNILRRKRNSMIQIIAFGIGIMVLLLLTLVRSDLLAMWRDSLPADASNRFVINIQPDQVQAVEAFFHAHDMGSTSLYPMIRGRLQSINGKEVVAQDQEDMRAQRLASREFNLSWADSMQSDNKIVAGKWWPVSSAAAGQAQVSTAQYSVEQGLAKTLGIKLGDSVTFLIAGQPLTAKVTSLRTVKWDTFKPNFFVLTPPGVLDTYPASYITSFYLAPDKAMLLNELVKTFPNLTVIDISAIMQHVRLIIERVSLAVEYVFLFTLMAGLMVLYAAIQATQSERQKENAILRSLGASKKRLLLSMLTEFSLLGAMAGLLAAIVALFNAYIVAERVMDLQYVFNGWILLTGLLGGSLGIGLAGTLGTRKVLVKPPLQTLRYS